MAFKVVEKEGMKVITIEELEQYSFVKHGFSTRVGGVSEGNYEGMNLGRKTLDTKENVLENTKGFCDALGVEMEHLVISKQVHGDVIHTVKEREVVDFWEGRKGDEGTDGLITNLPNIPLMTYYADCVPLFFVDSVHKAVGLSHAGWKGTMLKIGAKTVLKMGEEYGTRPDEVIVAIGPSIGQCCYEVDSYVVDKFNTNFTDISNCVIAKGEGKYMLDLWGINRIALEEIGVLSRNIIISQLCTSCNLDLFYSHRKEEGNTGRMASIIQIV